MDSIKKYKLLHNGNSINRFKSNNEIDKLCDDLEHFLFLDIEHFSFKVISEEDVLLLARRFLNNLVSLRSVPYLNSKYKVLDNSLLSSFKSYVLSIKINPYSIPINFSKDNDKDVKVNTFYDYCLNRLYYRDIDLRSHIDITSVASYIHELIHTQLEHVNAIKDFYNGEVLSVFFEIMYCLNLDNGGPLSYDVIINRVADLIRANNKVKSFDDNENIINGRYVNSIIKAFNLIDLYYSLDCIGRNKMLSDIQYIFDKKISLEDFLSKYNVSINNGIDSIRRLVLS